MIDMNGFIKYILPGLLLLVSPTLAGEERPRDAAAAPMVLTLEKAIEVALGQNKDVLIISQNKIGKLADQVAILLILAFLKSLGELIIRFLQIP